MTDAKAAPRRDRFPFLLGAAVALVLLAVGAAGLRSWRDLATQRAREAELEGAIAATEADVARLEERIERLGNDALALERLARHDLGMVRPDDTVFVFPAELSGRPAPPRPRAAAPATTPAPDPPPAGERPQPTASAAARAPARTPVEAPLDAAAEPPVASPTPSLAPAPSPS